MYSATSHTTKFWCVVVMERWDGSSLVWIMLGKMLSVNHLLWLLYLLAQVCCNCYICAFMCLSMLVNLNPIRYCVLYLHLFKAFCNKHSNSNKTYQKIMMMNFLGIFEIFSKIFFCNFTREKQHIKSGDKKR